MLDRLPGSVCQVLLYEWLSVSAIGRLDSALCVRGFRDEWSQLLRGTYTLFYVSNKAVLKSLKWCCRREMLFREYCLEVTQNNQTSRFAQLCADCNSVETLSVLAVTDPTKLVLEDGTEFGHLRRQCFPFCCYWREPESIPTYVRRLDVELEDCPQSIPQVTFSRLRTMTIEGACFKDPDWLPVAPNLETLTIKIYWYDPDHSVLRKAATMYENIRHLRLYLQRVDSASTMLESSKFSNLVSVTLKSSLYMRGLLTQCPQLRYVALIGCATNSTISTVVALGQRLEGLHLCSVHYRTNFGLASLANAFTKLRYFGLHVELRLPFCAGTGNALAQVLQGNANTLQEVCLWCSRMESAGWMRVCGDTVTNALAQCTELRHLHLATHNVVIEAGLAHILQCCPKLRTLRLPEWTHHRVISRSPPANIVELQELYPQLCVEYARAGNRDWSVWSSILTPVV